jgi:phosphoribosylformimino-5-aminoimidazole carboxamide ribotide isomerase
MEFRPCIDIHNGAVKQIIGSTLNDVSGKAVENFVSDKGAAYYAGLYRDLDLPGGHVIILNRKGSEYYDASKRQALLALETYPRGLMIGGGINDENAGEYIDAGASHVIVTSFVFSDGRINGDNLIRLADSVGADKIVLDLSCRNIEGTYRVVTDRWQKISDEIVNADLFERLSGYCDEFLVHAVDSEGRASGIDEDLIRILSESPKPCCYAGGISSCEDIDRIGKAGRGMVNFTVGSKLDIFGGSLRIEEILKCIR